MSKPVLLEDTVLWSGDLEDDCFADWNGIRAQCEKVDRLDWFVCIHLDSSEEYIFHSACEGVGFASGEIARKWCEILMRSYKAGVRWEAEK